MRGAKGISFESGFDQILPTLRRKNKSPEAIPPTSGRLSGVGQIRIDLRSEGGFGEKRGNSRPALSVMPPLREVAL